MENNQVDMGKVYDSFAEQFAKSDALPTWRYVGMPAMERLLAPHFAKPGAQFLDLGSASGRVEKGLLLPHGVAPEQITGIEISPDQVAIAQKAIPGAHFEVGDITNVTLPAEKFDVVFSHMVFEHLDDAQLLRTCKSAFDALKPGGEFVFVVTHPDKMTDLDGNLVTSYGEFTTSAPWGGVLHNWRRSVEQTKEILSAAGFTVDTAEDLKFPEVGTDPSAEDKAAYEKYSKYPAIRLAVAARKA